MLLHPPMCTLFVVPASNNLYYAQTSPIPQCIAFDNGIYTGGPSGNSIFYTGNADNSIIKYTWIATAPTGAAGTVLISATDGTALGINNPKGMV